MYGMLLGNFLYSLEHCIAPRRQYILEIIALASIVSKIQLK